MHPFDPAKRIDFQTFREELHGVFAAIGNKIEREWPTSVGTPTSQMIGLGHFRISLTAYETLLYFSAERPLNAPFRKPEFVVSAPPLVRSMLDALANVLFLFEDVMKRTEEFARRGWKEEFEHENRLRARYLNDPAWKDYLEEIAKRGEAVRESLGITEDDAKKLRRWPTLGVMISSNPKERDRILQDARREYLTFLNDWFYKDFSAETHLSPPGFARRAELVFREARFWDDATRTAQAILRSKAVTAAIGFLLAMSAEFEHELRFGMAARIIQIWTRLNEISPDLRDLYEHRAMTILTSPSSG